METCSLILIVSFHFLKFVRYLPLSRPFGKVRQVSNPCEANSAMPRIRAVVNKMMQIDGERIIAQGFWMNKKLSERLLLMKRTFELNISLICSRLSNVKVNFPPISHTFKDYGFQPF